MLLPERRTMNLEQLAFSDREFTLHSKENSPSIHAGNNPIEKPRKPYKKEQSFSTSPGKPLKVELKPIDVHELNCTGQNWVQNTKLKTDSKKWLSKSKSYNLKSPSLLKSRTIQSYMNSAKNMKFWFQTDNEAFSLTKKESLKNSFETLKRNHIYSTREFEKSCPTKKEKQKFSKQSFFREDETFFAESRRFLGGNQVKFPNSSKNQFEKHFFEDFERENDGVSLYSLDIAPSISIEKEVQVRQGVQANDWSEIVDSNQFLSEDESKVETIVFKRKTEPQNEKEMSGPLVFLASSFTAVAVTSFMFVKGIRSLLG